MWPEEECDLHCPAPAGAFGLRGFQLWLFSPCVVSVAVVFPTTNGALRFQFHPQIPVPSTFCSTQSQPRMLAVLRCTLQV
mmetsp:Transcript_47502/g.78114  ORF Transcript_47502/g.78114 Transcript_47502/m.78114 type:complete len:80 (-) Transcript_47502:378-617(-)